MPNNINAVIREAIGVRKEENPRLEELLRKDHGHYQVIDLLLAERHCEPSVRRPARGVEIIHRSSQE